jgi:hypothetical protein
MTVGVQCQTYVLLDALRPAFFTKEKSGLLSTPVKWQGRRDSNTQPMVLETTTLPIELLP